MVATTLLLVVLLGLGPVRPGPADRGRAVIRVMPFGDSLTWGTTAEIPPDPQTGTTTLWIGWRKAVYDALAAAGWSVDFVGDNNSDGGGVLADGDGAFFGGRTIANHKSRVPTLISTYRPRIITLLAGIPDAAIGTPNMAEQLEDLLATIHQHDPTAYTLLATTPVPVAPVEEWAPAIVALNDAMPAIVSRRQAAGQRITLVAMPPGVAQSSDGFHPSTAGYQQMAAAWTTALTALLDASFLCEHAARIRVLPSKAGGGGLNVTVQTKSQHNAIRAIRFGTAHGVRLVTTPVINGTTATFSVRRNTSVASAHLPFTVTDNCGEWLTFVGGGSGSF